MHVECPVHNLHDLLTAICGESDSDIIDGDDGGNDLSDLEGATPISERQRLAMEEALKRSVASGLYPMSSSCEGSSWILDPSKTMSLHSCSWFGQLLCVK